MEGIHQDAMYYNKVFSVYARISNRYMVLLNWMDSFFSFEVINVLEKRISRSIESLRILGVGCRSGDIDYYFVSQLLARYSKISNTVLEPTDTISDYKALVEVKPLPGLECNWRQQTLDEYYQSIRGTSVIPKFHFISAVAVLYYMKDWGAELMNMYNLVESGSVLMITLSSEDSGL